MILYHGNRSEILEPVYRVAKLFYNRYWNEEDIEVYKDTIDAFTRKYKAEY